AEADAFIPLEIVEQAASCKVEPTGETLDLGVDVARFGDDETVIAPRIGNKVFKLLNHYKQDTMETAGHVLKLAKEYMAKYKQLKRVDIKVDDSGVGGGVTDRLKEVIKSERLPFKVYPVVNNGKPLDDEHYDNAGAEGWAVVRDLLEENMKAFIQGEEPTMEIPNDEKMISQFSSRKYRITSRGKIALERKEEMKKRGLQSPDRADAIVLAFYKPKVVMGGKVKRV
ncbi:TPA: terminase B, partial [Bacillus thuringiensis]|nr:terminase B [Bacillus thuringiensis]